MALLLTKEISISEKYANFSDIFSKESTAVVPNYLNINKYAIDLESGKQISYRPIYSLDLLKLETLKTYIKTNLANKFIWPSKFSIKVLIFFVKKPDGSLCLYVDYRGLNNLTIKNWYPLFLINKLLKWLEKVKRFT